MRVKVVFPPSVWRFRAMRGYYKNYFPHTAFMKVLILTLVLAVPVCAFAGGAAVCTAQEDCRIVTALMYHGVLKSRQGEYIVSPERLEEDLINFKNAGYEFVLPCQVAAYAQGRGELPEKPLILTFDDGHYNNAYYALPLLEKHDACAVINVIGAFSEYSAGSGDRDNPNYSHLTWQNLRELLASGRIELGNHTWGMHKYSPRFGVGKRADENEKQYAAALFSDFSRLHEKVKKECGYSMTTFAYPFGKYTKTAEQVLKNMGYTLTFTCNEGVSKVTFGQPLSCFYIRRINMDGRASSSSLLKKAEGYYRSALSQSSSSSSS